MKNKRMSKVENLITEDKDRKYDEYPANDARPDEKQCKGHETYADVKKNLPEPSAPPILIPGVPDKDTYRL